MTDSAFESGQLIAARPSQLTSEMQASALALARNIANASALQLGWISDDARSSLVTSLSSIIEAGFFTFAFDGTDQIMTVIEQV